MGAYAARVCDGPDPAVNELLAAVPLMDHHVHAIVRGHLDATALGRMLTESDRPAASAIAGWDSQLGIAVRRWCAPILGLEAHASVEAYLARRLALTNEDAAGIFLPAAGLAGMMLDTGFRSDVLLDVAEIGALAGVPAWPVVRLEAIAEQVAGSGVGAAGYADAFRAALHAALTGAVATKTVVAYRHGLAFDPEPPTDAAVAHAAGDWLRSIATGATTRLTDSVLLRFGIWEAVRTGRPLQVHTGFGDTDLELHRVDPSLMTGFLRATEALCPVLLLHTYPFHRSAGYLAQMFGHVYLDVGLAVNHTGIASERIIGESLELAPLTKVLFSSDAWGLPELHLLGSWLFRRSLSRVLGGWVATDDWSCDDALRAVTAIASGNAARVYGVPSGPAAP